MANSTSNPPQIGLKAAAVFEALKGLLVILAGLGLLAFVHCDAQPFAERLALYLHLNPARHYPRIFIEAAGRLTDARSGCLPLEPSHTLRFVSQRPTGCGIRGLGQNGSALCRVVSTCQWR